MYMQTISRSITIINNNSIIMIIVNANDNHNKLINNSLRSPAHESPPTGYLEPLLSIT